MDGKGAMGLGIFCGFIVLCVLYVLFMWGYFAAKRKYAHSKYAVEILFFGLILAVSISVKIGIFTLIYGQSAFDGGFAAFVMGVYDSIGGFTFGNHPDVTLNLIEGITQGWLRGLCQCVYTGSIALTSMIFVSIIVARFNYELYSYIAFFGSEKKKEIFVFTALNEEALQMAKSIKDQRDDPTKKIIVFAGPSLDSFDRKKEICRQVMANGFLYWSYVKNNNSIAKILHLNNYNFNDYDKDFCVFAFETDNHTPKEEVNLDFVLSDVENRINAKKQDKLRIEYFILSNRNINYQAYQDRIDELKELDKSDAFSKKYVFHIWNEANEVARLAVQKVLDDGLRDTLAVDQAKGLTVYSIGFGGVAEAITNKFFVQSPGIRIENAQGIDVCVSRPYFVRAFEKEEDSMGIFRGRHPGYRFIDVDECESDDSVSSKFIVELWKGESEHRGMPIPVYCLQKLNASGQGFWDRMTANSTWFKDSEIPAPEVIVVATGDDYRNITIANTIIQKMININIDQRKKQYVLVNVFDKDSNKILPKFGGKFRQIKKAEKLGEKDEYDERIIEVDDKLTVFIVGNLEETYSYKGYIEREKDAACLNYTYSKAYENVDSVLTENIVDFIKKKQSFEDNKDAVVDLYWQLFAFTKAFYKIHNGKASENVEKLVKEIQDKICEADKFFAKKTPETDLIAYDGISLWEKFSNQNVVEVLDLYVKAFEKTFKDYIPQAYNQITAESISEDIKFFYKAAALEHDRWVRLHMSDGWVYVSFEGLSKQEKKRHKSMKQHDCIISFVPVEAGGASITKTNPKTTVYDVLNVLWAITKKDYSKDNEKGKRTAIMHRRRRNMRNINTRRETKK